MRVRAATLALLTLVLLAQAPQDKPADGMWRSPLYWAGALFLNNYNKTFGVAGLPFSGLDLLAVSLLLVLLFWARGEKARASPPLPSALWKALSAYALGLLALAGWGLLRGGSAGVGYWQIRQLAYLPLFALLLQRGLFEEELWLLGRLVVGTAVVKVLFGLYFYLAIALPRELQPQYITTHGDSLHFVLGAVIALGLFLEQPSSRNLRRCLWLLPLLLAGIYLNDRRIAYLGLVLCSLVLLLGSRRAFAKRLLLLGALGGGLYVAVGFHSGAALFKPVQAVRSLFAQEEDSSTESRVIENYNLARTVEAHPLLGTGLGHPYLERVKGPDISHAFALYQYIPHNSVLWLLSAGGLLGFGLVWPVFAAGAYISARAYSFARAPLDRVAAAACFCVVLLFLVQALGDMGTQSWSTVLLLALALVVSGRLARRTGAWPWGGAVALADEPSRNPTRGQGTLGLQPAG